jgi:hypothetical protein
LNNKYIKFYFLHLKQIKMKKLISLSIIMLVITAGIFAQAPQKMSYQAIIRDPFNVLVTNTTVGMQISILQGSPVGASVFVETHTPTTDANGLVSLVIGNGVLVSGSIPAITWGTGPFYMKTETDPTGGTVYTVSGTSQLLSVPYALYAETGPDFSGTLNRVAKFTPGGTAIGNSQIFDDGINVGIATVVPAYRLDVEHGGATGIHSKSTASFSVVDIDGFNGDAALRFQRAGVGQWNIRNHPANDDLQFFELGGGGERMRIEDGTGNVNITNDLNVGGTLSKGAGAFKIDHPLDPANKYLWHSFVESPDMMNIYNGNIVTDASGKATVQLPDYFQALNMEYRYQLTVIGSFAQAIISKKVNNNKFEISTSKPNIEVSWQVTGIRHDAYAEKNRIPNTVEKSATDKGKYLSPEAFNQPASKRIGYEDTKDGSIVPVEIKQAEKKEIPAVKKEN